MAPRVKHARRRAVEEGESSRPQGRRLEQRRQDLDFPDIIFESPEQWDRFQKLKVRLLVPSRYLDLDLLHTLHLYAPMQQLFHNLGIQRMFTLSHGSYPSVTLEILSSFQKLESGRGVSGFRFRFRNEEFSWTVEQLRERFGLPISGNSYLPDNAVAFELWEAITGVRARDASHLSTSLIHHPCLRLLLKFLATTIFGRGDHSNCRVNELTFLASALRTQRRATHQDLAIAAINHWYGVAVSKSKSPICIGGPLAQVASHHGFEEFNPHPLAITRLTHLFLKKASYLSPDEYDWRFEDPESGNIRVIRLPCDHLPSLAPNLPRYLFPPVENAERDEEALGEADEEEEERGEGVHEGQEARSEEPPHLDPSEQPIPDPSHPALPHYAYFNEKFEQIVAGQQLLMECMESMSLKYNAEFDMIRERLNYIENDTQSLLLDNEVIMSHFDPFWAARRSSAQPPHSGDAGAGPSHAPGRRDEGADPNDMASSPHPGPDDW